LRLTAYHNQDQIKQSFPRCVFRPIVTDRFGIVTAEFGNVTGDFGDVTAGPSVPA